MTSDSHSWPHFAVISDKPSLDVWRSALWGAAATLCAFAILAILTLVGPPLDGKEGKALGATRLLMAIVVAPLIESAVLVWIVRDVESSRWNRFVYIPCIGVAAALAHWPSKPHFFYLAVVGASFCVFALYVAMRSHFTSRNVVWLEASISHGVYNGLALVVAFALEQVVGG